MVMNKQDGSIYEGWIKGTNNLKIGRYINGTAKFIFEGKVKGNRMVGEGTQTFPDQKQFYKGKFKGTKGPSSQAEFIQ